MKSQEIKISVVIVNYRSKNNLEFCLDSFYDRPDFGLSEIIIVNNDKSESLEEIKKKYPEIKIIEAEKNLGFGKANNLGAKNAVGEILFFLNPDARIGAGRLEDILREFGKNEKLGVVGARLLEKSGRTQPFSCGEEPTLGKIFLNKLGIGFSKRKIFWVAATAFFVRKKFFEQLGGFDENIFMYFEDIDFCARSQKAGFAVRYFPDFSVFHLGGQSYFNKKKQKKDYYASQKYYFKKHRPKWEGCFLEILKKLTGK